MKSFFVSYNQADRAWAEWIAWQLEEAGRYSTVLQAWDFRPGCNFVVEMQRATVEAERTIAVLSSNYLTALFTQPEWAAALGSDPTGQKKRLVPVRVGECTPSGMLAQLVWIDLVGLAPEEAATVLLDGLKTDGRRPPQPPVFPGAERHAPRFPGGAGTTRDVWLLTLSELLQIPAVQKAVVACQVNCDAMCQQIDDLMNYKELHDQLHQLQFNCYEPIVRTVKACTLNDEIRETLAEYALNLREIVEGLREIDGRLDPDARGAEWIQRLADAHQKLLGAIDNADPERLRSVTSDLRRVLDRQPSRINEWIIQSARELRLSRLVRALAEVCDELSEHDIETGKLDAFKQGLAGLDRLTADLNATRDNHAEWQKVDVELRLIDVWLDRPGDELAQAWLDVKGYLDPLCGGSSDTWAVELRAAGERLDRSITEQQGEASQLFRRFRRQAGLRFYRVDTDMKRLCEQLRLTGLPLVSALRG